MTRSAAAGTGVILEARVEDEILDWDLKNRVSKNIITVRLGEIPWSELASQFEA